MAATSILKRSWRDEVGPAAAFDRREYSSDSELLLLSNSKSMWSGFDQHWNGYDPMPPLGFTNIRAFPGETHSMMISGGERPFTSGKSQKDQGQIAYSRLTWQPGAWKRLHLCTTFTILGSDVYSWAVIDLAFDIQAWDNSDRGHFRAQLVDNWEGDAALPLWKIARNDVTPGSGGYATVPNSRPSMMGENENKGGWQFARLSIDLENTQAGAVHGSPSAPDTIGRYLELQCNDKVMDLTGITAGQGWQDPQDPDPIGDYRGGCNPGVGGWRSTRNPSRQMNLLFGPTWVVVEK